MKRKVLVENEPRYFYCRDCDCFFEADRDDYKLVEDADKRCFVVASYLDCGQVVTRWC